MNLSVTNLAPARAQAVWLPGCVGIHSTRQTLETQPHRSRHTIANPNQPQLQPVHDNVIASASARATACLCQSTCHSMPVQTSGSESQCPACTNALQCQCMVVHTSACQCKPMPVHTTACQCQWWHSVATAVCSSAALPAWRRPNLLARKPGYGCNAVLLGLCGLRPLGLNRQPRRQRRAEGAGC